MVRQALGAMLAAEKRRDSDHEEPESVAHSTRRATVRDAKDASVPLRRVRADEVRREEFLYELKAGPAGGLRPPSGPATTRQSPGNRPHPQPWHYLPVTGN
jgi:hypothetical protein